MLYYCFIHVFNFLLTFVVKFLINFCLHILSIWLVNSRPIRKVGAPLPPWPFPELIWTFLTFSSVGNKYYKPPFRVMNMLYKTHWRLLSPLAHSESKTVFKTIWGFKVGVGEKKRYFQKVQLARGRCGRTWVLWQVVVKSNAGWFQIFIDYFMVKIKFYKMFPIITLSRHRRTWRPFKKWEPILLR